MRTLRLVWALMPLSMALWGMLLLGGCGHKGPLKAPERPTTQITTAL